MKAKTYLNIPYDIYFHHNDTAGVRNKRGRKILGPLGNFHVVIHHSKLNMIEDIIGVLLVEFRLKTVQNFLILEIKN